MSTNPLSTSLVEPLYAGGFFCTIIATAFYGFACMQTFFYYVHYENDPWRIKIFVAVIWALNTVHEALTVSGVYKYIAAALENPLSPINWFPELILQTFLTVLVAILTQGFLMYRIYVFSGKKIITLLLWLVLSILQLVLSIVYISKALYTNSSGFHGVTVLDTTLMTTLTLCLCIAAGEDILIAILLVSLLIRHRATGLFASTAHLLQRLTVFAVNTGTWTALFALLTLIFLHVLPLKMLYAVFGVPLCSIYCNTVLANLNARTYLRDGSGMQHVREDLFASATPGSGGRRGEAKLVFAPPEDVRRTTELVTFSDANMRSTISEDA